MTPKLIKFHILHLFVYFRPGIICVACASSLLFFKDFKFELENFENLKTIHFQCFNRILKINHLFFIRSKSPKHKIGR